MLRSVGRWAARRAGLVPRLADARGTRWVRPVPRRGQLPRDWDDDAPDGSGVRVLCRLDGASTAHFELGPHQVSRLVTDRGWSRRSCTSSAGAETLGAKPAGRATQTGACGWDRR